jgi:hypothetical protein
MRLSRRQFSVWLLRKGPKRKLHYTGSRRKKTAKPVCLMEPSPDIDILENLKSSLVFPQFLSKQRENKETKGFEEAWAYHFAGENRRRVRAELRQPFGEEGVLRVLRKGKEVEEIGGF